MKLFKSILITFFCAVAVLIIGYAGIVLSGEQILQVPSEPEPVTMEGDISGLFYSKIEDDIQLYPWNYYPGKQDNTAAEGDSPPTNVFSEKDTASGPFEEYSLFLENDVFYMLIALAADVDPQEVSQWYGQQGKTIMMNMVQGREENEAVDVFFYDEAIRLNGKEYQVEISCNQWSIISFSCIQQQDENVKKTEKWKEQKEILAKWMEENPGKMELIYSSMYNMNNYYDRGEWIDLSRYVELYQKCLDEIHNAVVSGGEEWEKEQTETEIILEMKDNEGLRVQMIELKDSLLLVTESDITMGIYYDVLKQRVTGFHFFWD